MKKKVKIFFHPIDGSGALTLSWSSGPKGDALEASKGAGVGFFSAAGDLLCVIFDEVQCDHDHQVLEFKNYYIEVSLKEGHITHKVIHTLKTPSPQSRRKTKKIIV